MRKEVAPLGHVVQWESWDSSGAAKELSVRTRMIGSSESCGHREA